jgi:hypothetical protein
MTGVQQLLTARGNFQVSTGMFLIQSSSSEVPTTKCKCPQLTHKFKKKLNFGLNSNMYANIAMMPHPW